MIMLNENDVADGGGDVYLSQVVGGEGQVRGEEGRGRVEVFITPVVVVRGGGGQGRVRGGGLGWVVVMVAWL